MALEPNPLHHLPGGSATGPECIVDFDSPDDPYRPRNWPRKKKLITTALYGLITMTATWTTSIYSPAVKQVSAAFNVSNEVSLLGLSFCLLECEFPSTKLLSVPK
ncbi:uncharacterized protein BDW43DRAFT_289915 [Aspergillus alliaceus]|uniref:uncharacterized protein n=1 Tax=Petromyces alliaceus TaxID=209559 RepID=UPI0012A71A2A|nr:uncharacterized protein BDW43DRAFT_289915 [Aspergillus alliaceus]KAB8228868.1 hypothetical protein BDW43DRAFT_289915 [Aspergillus alliaceus]